MLACEFGSESAGVISDQHLRLQFSVRLVGPPPLAATHCGVPTVSSSGGASLSGLTYHCEWPQSGACGLGQHGGQRWLDRLEQKLSQTSKVPWVHGNVLEDVEEKLGSR